MSAQWHVTKSAQRDWARYKRMMEDASSSSAAPGLEAQPQEPWRQAARSATSPAQKRQKTANDTQDAISAPFTVPLAAEEDADFVFDTVGAVCVDAQGEEPNLAVT